MDDTQQTASTGRRERVFVVMRLCAAKQINIYSEGEMGRKREFTGTELFSFDNVNKKEKRPFTANDPTTLLRYGLRKNGVVRYGKPQLRYVSISRATDYGKKIRTVPYAISGSITPLTMTSHAREIIEPC